MQIKTPLGLEHHQRPGFTNYIYRSEDGVVGGQEQEEAQPHSQADRAYKWESRIFTEQHVSDALALMHRMESEEGPSLPPGLQAEHRATRRLLADFKYLDQRGMGIWVDNQLAAFSIFEPMSTDTAVIHVEKGDRKWKKSIAHQS
jgi:hypothetical protein